MYAPEVLIVGAGPTGLLMAAELARAGVNLRIIDSKPHIEEHSKAIGIQARTLEMFEDIGIVDQFLERGQKFHAINFYADGERLSRVNFDNLDSPYPFVLSIPQHTTERLLGALVTQRGHRIERGITLINAHQEADGLLVTLQHATGHQETCFVRWLLGCDGAHSAVRRIFELPYEGDDIEGLFCLADVIAYWDYARDESHLHFSPQGSTLFLPLPKEKHWRLIFTYPPEEKIGEPNLAFFVRTISERLGFEPIMEEAGWMSIFRVHQRKVGHYRKGHVFLAGDAAHCHSPFGGQGMNTGLQDAYNLAWKLALVNKGSGRSVLLDSYSSEREPIAKSLLKNTGLVTQILTTHNPITQGLRKQATRIFSNLETVQQHMTRTIGEIDLHYRNSPISKEHHTSLLHTQLSTDRTNETTSIRDWRDFSSAPHAGDRAPDAQLHDPQHSRLYPLLNGSMFNLLLFRGHAHTTEGTEHILEIAQKIHAVYHTHLRVHVVVPEAQRPTAFDAWGGSLLLDPQDALHNRYGAGTQCLYLIRPDNYIAFRSLPADLTRLQHYLSTLFL